MNVHVPKARDQEFPATIYDARISWNARPAGRPRIFDSRTANDYCVISERPAGNNVDYCNVSYRGGLLPGWPTAPGSEKPKRDDCAA